jgi:hypothetical protein
VCALSIHAPEEIPMPSFLERTERAAVVAVLAASLLTAVPSHAANRPGSPSLRSLDVARDLGERGHWLEHLPRSVQRLIAAVQDMLVGPHP